MKKTKLYEELTIQDYFIFGKICSKPENRKLILDSLLQIDFKEKTGEVEKHIQQYKSSKFVRLDLLVEDIDGTVYNTEMQNKSNNINRQKELPNRSRYYQSLLDTTYLNTGESYQKLPETYIVFICTFDPFGYNLPIYSFETKCNENEAIKLNDNTHKIFFNTTADLSNLPQDMQNMLLYINTGTVSDEATKKIDLEVNEARQKEEWRIEYMLTYTIQDELRAEGREEGREEGLKEGRAEAKAEIAAAHAEIEKFKKFLLSKGYNPDEIE